MPEENEILSNKIELPKKLNIQKFFWALLFGIITALGTYLGSVLINKVSSFVSDYKYLHDSTRVSIGIIYDLEKNTSNNLKQLDSEYNQDRINNGLDTLPFQPIEIKSTDTNLINSPTKLKNEIKKIPNIIIIKKY